MMNEAHRTEPSSRMICWKSTWNKKYPGVGLEHLLLSQQSADSVVLAVDEEHGPFRLMYKLSWDDAWQIRDAELTVVAEKFTRSLILHADGRGRWKSAKGDAMAALDGCLDIDIWPTPFTNTFPILREPMAVGERREFLMSWVFAPTLEVKPQPQAYTRLADRLYLFESLDGDGFRAELSVDEHGLVLDYPELFQRL